MPKRVCDTCLQSSCPFCLCRHEGFVSACLDLAVYCLHRMLRNLKVVDLGAIVHLEMGDHQGPAPFPAVLSDQSLMMTTRCLPWSFLCFAMFQGGYLGCILHGDKISSKQIVFQVLLEGILHIGSGIGDPCGCLCEVLCCLESFKV